MKKEIEEITTSESGEFKISICEAIEELFGGFLEMDGYDRWRVRDTADKIISLIEQRIGECEDEIRKYLYEIFTINLPKTIDLTQDIINIIKSKIKE